VSICTNKMFIMIFNSRVSVLNRNPFWPLYDDLTKLEVNKPLILDPWMICNLYVLLISWNLVWFGAHVVWFIHVHVWCSSCSSFFFCDWSISFKIFWVFVLLSFFLLCLIYFIQDMNLLTKKDIFSILNRLTVRKHHIFFVYIRQINNAAYTR
jgi:hypothetical protein